MQGNTMWEPEGGGWQRELRACGVVLLLPQGRSWSCIPVPIYGRPGLWSAREPRQQPAPGFRAAGSAVLGVWQGGGMLGGPGFLSEYRFFWGGLFCAMTHIFQSPIYPLIRCILYIDQYCFKVVFLGAVAFQSSDRHIFPVLDGPHRRLWQILVMDRALAGQSG